MSSLVSSALSKWICSTSSILSGRKSCQHEDLYGSNTGEQFDNMREEEQPVEQLDELDVKLRPSQEIGDLFWTCRAHVVDVQADGNCGFNAFVNAATRYGGKTAIGTNMPANASQGRELLVRYLRLKRNDIEAAFNSHLSEETLNHLLWKDANCNATVPQLASSSPNMSFEELCLSIPRTGVSGHWLASGIGEIELHILARALGVTLHCVSLSRDAEDERFLREKMGPSLPFWTGRFEGYPKGAIVIRFLGERDKGHYQIVKCGRRSVTGGDRFRTHFSHQLEESRNPQQTQQPRPSTRKRGRRTTPRQRVDRDVNSDVQVVDQLRGVQRETKQRYSKDYKLVVSTFQQMSEEGIDPLRLDVNGAAVVQALKRLLMKRCGPKKLGYDGNKASSTGNVLLAAVKLWYNDQGMSFSSNHDSVLRGDSVSGPPWKTQQVLEFKESLGKIQAKQRSNPIRRAYLLTHDDVVSAMRRYVASCLGEALDHSFSPGTNPSVDWEKFQTSLMVTSAFGSGLRGAEIVGIKLSDLILLSEGPDTAIGVMLQGVKSKSSSKIVRRALFPSWQETSVINPALSVLTQISVVHGLTGIMENPDAFLFPHVERNQIQKGMQMSSDTYSAAVKNLFISLGITDKASEHSPRRGGSGFRYYVLGENLDYIRDFLSHESIADTLTYIGFRDKLNSYICQGYGTCGSGALR